MNKTCLAAIIVFVGFSIQNSNAQSDGFLFRHFREKKSVTYGLNNRRTNLFQENSTIYGAYLGIQFGNDLKHVVTLNSTLLWAGRDTEHFTEPTEVLLNFVGFSEEFVFWKRNRWSFNTYLHIGVGQAHARAIDPGIMSIPHTSRWVIPLEGGLQNEYTVNSWLSIRSGFGYRRVFNSGDWPLHGMYVKVGAGVKIKELLVVFDNIKELRENLFRKY